MNRGPLTVTGRLVANQVMQDVNTPYLLVPAGVTLPYAGNTVPGGYLFCDGSAISRTDYSELFEVIGTSFGVGDGSTTFNLPDTDDRCIVGSGDTYIVSDTGGADSATLSISNMPAHTHSLTLARDDGNSSHTANQHPAGDALITESPYNINTNSAGSGTAFSIKNKYLVLRYIIKY